MLRFPNNEFDDDIDRTYEQWLDLFSACVKESVPMKTVSDKSKHHPWVTRDLSKLCTKKRHLFRHASRSGNPDDMYRLRTFSRSLKTKLIKSAADHVKSLADRAHNDSKAFWQFISKRRKASAQHCFKLDDNTIITDPAAIAEHFNDFYAGSFTQDAAGDCNSNCTAHCSVVHADLVNHISTIDITPEMVYSILSSLNVSKSAGPDLIPNRILKECAGSLAAPLCRLFNKSLSLGRLPSEWKSANVTPLFKGGGKDSSLFDSYRPVSITSAIGKVLEK